MTDPSTQREVKSLSEKGEARIQLDKKLLNATTLLLAVLSVVTLQVTGTNHIYLHYIPKPSFNRWVNWGDMVFLLKSINLLGYLTGLYGHRGPARRKEEGEKFTNYTLVVQGIPIYVSQGTHCLSVTIQIYLCIVKLLRIFMINFICFTHLVLEDRR